MVHFLCFTRDGPEMDLFILKINKKVNKHFGFATFITVEDKERALLMKKLKIKKYKISFKEFKAESLEKTLFKKKSKKPKVDSQIEIRQEVNNQEEQEIHEPEVQVNFDTPPQPELRHNLENPEDAIEILKSKSLEIKSNHHLPGNISFNHPPVYHHRRFPTGENHDLSTGRTSGDFFLVFENSHGSGGDLSDRPIRWRRR